MIPNNLCNGSNEPLKYLLKWPALCLKRPWVKCVTALVFQGPQGCGKDTFANTLMGSFWGKGLHCSHIMNADHLCGTFYGIVSTSIFIVLDECIFPGNHSNARVLKSLFHDEQKMLRQLYKNAVMSPLFDHLIISSNCHSVSNLTRMIVHMQFSLSRIRTRGMRHIGISSTMRSPMEAEMLFSIICSNGYQFVQA